MFRRLAVPLALLLTIAACGSEPASAPEDGAQVEEAPEGSAEAAAGELTVVATVFPLAWMAEQVAPDAEVTLLASGGQDPHDLELSPADRALLESADVVLYLGDIDFQPQVEAAVGEATGAVVAVSDSAGQLLRELGGHEDEHHDEHSDEHHDDDGHDDEHGHEGVDPHVWFDAALMAGVAEELGAVLAEVDEVNATSHQQQAQALHDELAALDAEIDQLLAGCTHDTAIVSHEAYAYLLEPRGLNQEGISGAGGHGEASPQRLAELTERIDAEGIPAVAAEPFEGRADAEALAAEAGVDLVEIDPLEVDDDAPETGYPQLLREQAESFARALDCG